MKESPESFFKNSGTSPPDDVIEERHYTAKELAKYWNYSTDMIRKMFRKEEGVVIFKNITPGKRLYQTMRIPKSVAERVHRRQRN
jgi:hypothetical protein